MTRLQGTIAITAIVAMAACIAVIVLAGREIYRTIGPSKAVAAADGRLYLVSHGKIHVFGASGQREAAYDLEALGASPTPSDIAVHRDGRVVVASPDGSNLRRCVLATAACETIDPKLTGVPLQHVLPLNSVKVAIDEEGGRYFLSDNAGHRVVETDFAGRALAETAPGAVHYPNQLVLEAPGQLRVVDTNHRRIVTFAVANGMIGPVLREMPTGASGIARGGRVWPFDALRTPSGETWALVAAEGMKDADLIVYDTQGKARRRIDLGEDSDPFDIELWGDRVLVADATRYRIDAVDLSGKGVAALHDASFDSELASARERPESWREGRTAATFGIPAIALLAIFFLKQAGVPVGVKLEHKAPEVSRADAMGLAEETRWVLPSPGFAEQARRKMRSGVWIQLAGLAAFGLVIVFSFGPGALDNPKGHQLLVLFGLFVALHALIIPLALRNAGKQVEGYRIGASREGLRYEVPRRMAGIGRAREGRAPWRDVYYDGRRILAGRRMLPLRTPQGVPIFDAEEARKVVVANIPPANVVSQDKLMLRQLGPFAWLIFAGLVGAMVWLLARTFV